VKEVYLSSLAAAREIPFDTQADTLAASCSGSAGYALQKRREPVETREIINSNIFDRKTFLMALSRG
jgi:hypothetical protein